MPVNNSFGKYFITVSERTDITNVFNNNEGNVTAKARVVWKTSC